MTPSTPISKSAFFNAWWPWMEEAGCQSLILHGWEDMPEIIPSDIDFAVSGVSPDQYLDLLDRYCAQCGWELVQVIEHEFDALYAICFQRGSQQSSIILDVTWDYRRKGEVLIDNGTLFQGRWKPNGKPFYSAAKEVEFLYDFVKSASKGKPINEMRARLKPLFEETPDRCRKSLERWLNRKPGVAHQLEEARWSDIEKIYKSSPAVVRLSHSRRIRMKEIKLYLRRVMEPTGLIVSYPPEVSSESLKQIAEILKDAFRWIKIESRGVPLIRRWTRRWRSTLLLVPEASRGVVDLALKNKLDFEELSDDVMARNLASQVLDYMSHRIVRQRLKLPSLSESAV